MEAPNEVRTRDLTLTKRMLCQLSYKGTSGGVNPPCNPGAAQCCDSDYGSDQRRHVRRDSIGAITSRCGRENLGATPSLGTFFFFFAAISFFSQPSATLQRENLAQIQRSLRQTPLPFDTPDARRKNRPPVRAKTDWSGIRTHASEETSA